jgi:hypothetical protein
MSYPAAGDRAGSSPGAQSSARARRHERFARAGAVAWSAFFSDLVEAAQLEFGFSVNLQHVVVVGLCLSWQPSQ